MNFQAQLQKAWSWRHSQGLIVPDGALRIFHGPGEGSGPLEWLAIDRFGDHYWVTEWERQNASKSDGRRDPSAFEAVKAELETFLREVASAKSAVILRRPERGIAPLSEAFFGEVPAQPFVGGEADARFWIRFSGVRHPGLFLDHRPLREWLRESCKGIEVLNTFAYTGSLSVAAALGGATGVTTLDLSKPTIQWASENWSLNGFPAESGRFISGDVFEWLPRLKREGKVFGGVILDPPSFSRGKKGNFSTAKDLTRLHRLALDLIVSGGFLATSINSANVSWKKYERDVQESASETRCRLKVVQRIELPANFPVRREEDRYLKGWIFEVNR